MTLEAGPELDRQVAEAVGVEPLGWRPKSTGSKAWNSMDVKLMAIDDRSIEYRHKPYSTDPAANAELREIARKDLGHAFVIEDQPNGPNTPGYIAWVQTDPGAITEPDYTDDHLELYLNVGRVPGQRGDTEEHAVALAVLAAAKAVSSSS